ncbi:MAG: SET domain-containing protein-lysine N-methyltransferase [Chloroflexi bacterium]|nr:SET domain-containing protein-lysine N-methyltransferase [Chloroflexota bacterium]
MISQTYLPQTWLDPRQEIRPSPIQGMGIFAHAAIQPGEIVEIIGGLVITEAEFRAFQATADHYNAVQIGENLHLVECMSVTQQRAGSLNHACDSNLWLADEVTSIARRAIGAGEELTIDYALFTVQRDWSLAQPCRCGALDCRQQITGEDWRLLTVQRRYYPHFSPFINARIAATVMLLQ